MQFIDKTRAWSHSHYKSMLIAGLRVLLGLALLAKTILLIRANELPGLLYQSIGFNSWALVAFIILLQIAAGFLIMIGLFTRYAAMAMIPIMICAVIFVAVTGVYINPVPEFILSFVVLVGCLFFAVYGSGYYSADLALFEETKTNEKFYWRGIRNEADLNNRLEWKAEVRDSRMRRERLY